MNRIDIHLMVRRPPMCASVVLEINGDAQHLLHSLVDSYLDDTFADVLLFNNLPEYIHSFGPQVLKEYGILPPVESFETEYRYFLGLSHVKCVEIFNEMLKKGDMEEDMLPVLDEGDYRADGGSIFSYSIHNSPVIVTHRYISSPFGPNHKFLDKNLE